MKNISHRGRANRLMTAAAFLAVTALIAPVAFAQRGGGRGRGDAAPAKPVPAPTSPVTGNAVAGKGLYYSFGCYACHGYGGETGGRAFVGRWGHLQTEQAFVTFLRERVNVAPLTPAQTMPNFSKASLSDKQANDIYAYIRTFKSTAPASVSGATALSEIVAAAKKEK
jgi:mono/diheme cytochrome c family protein